MIKANQKYSASYWLVIDGFDDNQIFTSKKEALKARAERHRANKAEELEERIVIFKEEQVA